MTAKWVGVALGICALGLASAAQAIPYFEVVGGTEEKQKLVETGNVIPRKAWGWENRQDSPLPMNQDPITITLRDTTAPDDTVFTIVIDYIGTDATSTNEFSAGGGAVQWCNKTSGCSTGFTPLGAGNDDWFGNYAATGSFTARVGDQIDFRFFSDVNGSAPSNFGNGESIFLSHMGVFNLEGGFEFDKPPPPLDRTGTILALGLTDGVTGNKDDDHQDFMVRLSVSTVPEPGAALLIGSGAAGLALLLRRRRPRGRD